MLTIRQVDSVVQANLFVIKGWEHERQEQGTTILYTVWTNVTSPKLYLGIFRVWEWVDGGGRCGWQPLPEITPEQKKLRDFFHLEMIMPILAKADNKSNDQNPAQPTGNKNLIVKLNRNDVYRQLLAMCNDGEDYSLQQGDHKDEKLECLTVADRKAITAHPNTTAKDKILGYIRLLPNGDDTLITFVHKNRPEWYNYPVVNPELWGSFINAVFEYFKDNSHLDAPRSADPNDAQEYKEFSFRLSKATKEGFWKSVTTAKVAEMITNEAHGNYGIEFYIERRESDLYCIGVSHSTLLPRHFRLEILHFEFTPIGDGLRVNVHYRNFETYRAYLAGLFREIAKDWTEAQQEINKVIAELTGQPASVDAGQLTNANYLTREQILSVTESVEELEKRYKNVRDVIAPSYLNGGMMLASRPNDVLDLARKAHDAAIEPISKLIQSVGTESKSPKAGKPRKKKKAAFKPWEHIPDEKTNRKIVELWCKGKNAKEIGGEVFMKAETIHNIISNLRNTFPKAKIPKDRERKSMRF